VRRRRRIHKKMASISSTRGSIYRPSYSRTNSSSENLPPRTLNRIAREIRDLHKKPPEGVRLVVDGEWGGPTTLGEVLAEIEGPQGTPYETKHFQLKLVLSADFPASPPRGFFLTKIYHPNVDMSTGAICVNTLKRDWTSETTFSHVLSVIRCLMMVPFPESSLNDEAGKLFMESYDEYSKRAHLMADVHGRPYQTGKTAPTVENSKDRRNNNQLDTSIYSNNKNNSSGLKPTFLSSDNPCSSRNNNPLGNNNGSGSSGNKKKDTKRLSKKKSLKRL